MWLLVQPCILLNVSTPSSECLNRAVKSTWRYIRETEHWQKIDAFCATIALKCIIKLRGGTDLS